MEENEKFIEDNDILIVDYDEDQQEQDTFNSDDIEEMLDDETEIEINDDDTEN